jgi:UDP-N-acetylmuramoylalanine--D-glutamate ligase
MNKWKNKKVVVLGLGRSGIAAVTLLKRLGAKVRVSEIKENISSKIPEELKDIDIEFGRHSRDFISWAEIVVISPGIPLDNDIVRYVRGRNISIYSEIELAYSICPAKVIAITGTNGKSTTCHIVYHILKNAGRKVFLAGNVGLAFSEISYDLNKTDIVVLEISSFQLETIINFRPYIAAILNMASDHLDRYKKFEDYIQAKKRIFSNQKNKDYALVNIDDELASRISSEPISKKIYFSQKKVPENKEKYVCVKDGFFIQHNGEGDKRICRIDRVKIKSEHNRENILCALAAVMPYKIPVQILDETIQGFKGLEHRMEPVAEIRGVSFFNDSKATNIHAVEKSLRSLPGNVILIAGGKDKKEPYRELISIVKEKVKLLILLGEAAGIMKEIFSQAAETVTVLDMKSAVIKACSAAKSGDYVLLSPACSSYDMFENFEERGRCFKKVVKEVMEGKN